MGRDKRCFSDLSKVLNSVQSRDRTNFERLLRNGVSLIVRFRDETRSPR